MNGSLVAVPSSNVTNQATLTWPSGTPDPDYPVTNLVTLEPDVPAKLTTGGPAILRATFPAARTLQGAALINTNLMSHDVELTNNAGMPGQLREVVSPEDRLCANVYWDLRGVANTTATEWSFSIAAGAAPTAIGTLLLLQTWAPLRVRWDWELRDVFPVIEQRTGYGKRLQYQVPTRVRKYTALAFWAADRDVVRALRREAHGSVIAWPLVPDIQDDDVLLVQFVEDEQRELYRLVYGTFPAGTAHGVVDMPLEVEEVNAGVQL